MVPTDVWSMRSKRPQPAHQRVQPVDTRGGCRDFFVPSTLIASSIGDTSRHLNALWHASTGLLPPDRPAPGPRV